MKIKISFFDVREKYAGIFICCMIAVYSVLSFSFSYAQERDDYYADSIIFTDSYWPSERQSAPYYRGRIRSRLKKKPGDLYYNVVLTGNLINLRDLYKRHYENQTVKSNGGFLLRLAAHEGHINIVDYLISEGIDIEAGVPEDTGSGNKGMTALMYAAKQSQNQMVVYLIKKGADVNAQSADGISSLHLAAKSNNPGGVRILLKYGADVNTKMLGGNTPLHMSAYHGMSLVTEMLIRNGADVDARNESGNGPLHLASMKYTLHDAKILILSGANVNLKNNKRKTPLDVVGEGWIDMSGWKASKKSMIQLLRHYGGR